MVIENAIIIYTDGSCYSHPRVGGIGIRLVIINEEGHEEFEDISPPGFKGATNNEMELYACIEGIKQAMRRPYFSNFDHIAIQTDSQYVCNHVNTAIYEWSKNKWFNRQGRPINNAALWKDLIRILKALDRNQKRFRFYWVKGHSKDVHNRAADKLARESAKRAIKPPLSTVEPRRKISTKSVEIGSVPMLNQQLLIHIITKYHLKTQRLYKYKYEVLSQDSPWYGNVDIACADPEINLRANHYYSVKFNDNRYNPRIVELLEEFSKDGCTLPNKN